MPKRKNETKEERYKRKIEEYESRLKKSRTELNQETEVIEETERQPEPEPEPDWWYSSYDDIGNEFNVPNNNILSETPVEPFQPTPMLAPPVPVQPLSLEPTPDTDVAIAGTSGDFDIDPELLKALGSLEEEKMDWGDPIVEQIAIRLKPLLSSGLKKEEKGELIKKFPVPRNLQLAKAPTLNAEISAVLNEGSRNRDKRLSAKQNQIGAVLSGVTKAMSLLMLKDPKIMDVLSTLSDASRLLADSHYLETDTRKSLVTPLIDKELTESFKDRKRDAFLFGDNLGELVKNSRGIKRTGQLIQGSSKPNLNSKGPPSRGRQIKNNSYRDGGQQRPYLRRIAPVPYPPANVHPRRPQTYVQRRQPPLPVQRTSAAKNDRTASKTEAR